MAEMSPEPHFFMLLGSTDKHAMPRGNRGFDPAKHRSVRRGDRLRAKICPRMQVRHLMILVDESQNIEFLPAPGCRLFHGLHLFGVRRMHA